MASVEDDSNALGRVLVYGLSCSEPFFNWFCMEFEASSEIVFAYL